MRCNFNVLCKIKCHFYFINDYIYMFVPISSKLKTQKKHFFKIFFTHTLVKNLKLTTIKLIYLNINFDLLVRSNIYFNS